MKDIKYRSYYFAVAVLKYISRLKEHGFYNPLIRQVVRSTTSIGANVVEGRSGSSTKDMIKFYTIALKSANETKYWLCLLRDTMQLKNTEISPMIKEADEISRILAASIITMKGKLKSERLKVKSKIIQTRLSK